jgi:hypothetical protein
MTGEELKAIQTAAGLSDAAFLEALGLAPTSAARRRLRRWKTAEAVPEKAAAAAASLSAVQAPRVPRRAPRYSAG